MPPSLFIIPVISVPALALGITAYLYNHPLAASRTAAIRIYPSISPSCKTSKSLQTLVNPHNHIAVADSYSIRLSSSEICGRSDEEILATFTHGLFGGWVFSPERYAIRLLEKFGLRIVPMAFSKIPSPGPKIQHLSTDTLPPIHSLLFGGNFIVLDTSVSIKEERRPAAQAFVEIGYGHDRKHFVGMHRFEVCRDNMNGDEGVIIWYSSISCDPSVNKPVFPSWFFEFHKFYAFNLFRDGIAAVLEAI
ncbi:hypothetical protein ACMFMF_005471 [Clarireedia jacksonii]